MGILALMHNEAFETIKAASRVLLHLHPKPDPDSIGSALATYHALKGLGKEVTVIQGDSELPEIFSGLPGYGDIVRKSYFDIDLGEFDLFIIQDSGSKHIISRKAEVVFPSHLKTIIIDHHKTNEKFADINIVDATYAATAELLYDLFIEWEITITPEIAANLYFGIYGDTGGFKYLSTTPRTFKIAAHLAELYPDFPKLISDTYHNHKKEALFFDALVLNSIETFFDDTVAISSVSFDELQKRGITVADTDNNLVANMLISVKNWKIGVTLIEKESNVVGISFRSKDDIDVSMIAQKIGGGGHKQASGARLVMSLEDAKKKVIEAISSSL